MTDIIDLIDQAITPTCHQCGAELGDSLSNDFCGPGCQQAWHAARVDPLVGYEEPSDLPQHVRNLVELSSPETTPSRPDGSFLMPGYIREQMGRYLRELATHTTPPPALRRPQVEPPPDGLRRDMTDDRRYMWIGPHPGDGLDHVRHAVNALRRPQPFDPGAPWIRSPITPPAATTPTTAVFIGGRRHGQTIPVPNPPRHTISVVEDDIADRLILFNSDNLYMPTIVGYQLKAHNGAHWCYVDPRPAAPQRTINADGHEPLTIDYHHRNNARLMWWVTITARSHGVVCELPDELLADDTALWVWFTERSRRSGYPITDGSWEITEARPPFRREQP